MITISPAAKAKITISPSVLYSQQSEHVLVLKLLFQIFAHRTAL